MCRLHVWPVHEIFQSKSHTEFFGAFTPLPPHHPQTPESQKHSTHSAMPNTACLPQSLRLLPTPSYWLYL